MATTTNYGWTTPDDTALVKDGASAIRTLGTSIDTTTKNLNPSTTLGDIEYRSSTSNTNTRVGIGSSGQALTVVAGVPSWAASPTSVLTTTGDSLYASAANTLARLGIGSTGQVLTVAAGLPSWATPAASGSMTLLSTTTLSGATTTISGIVGGYKSLVAYIYGVTNATASGDLRIAPNGDTTITGLVGHYGDTQGNNDIFVQSTLGYLFANYDPYNIDRTVSTNFWQLEIPQYTDAVNYKTFFINGQFRKGTTAHDAWCQLNGLIKTTSAITSLVFSNSGGNLSTGTVLLYGVN